MAAEQQSLILEGDMRKAFALGLATMMAIVTPAGSLAAGAVPAGTISGVARDMRGGHLVNAGVRARLRSA